MCLGLGLLLLLLLILLQASASRSHMRHGHDEAIDGSGVDALALRRRAQQRTLVRVEELRGGTWLRLRLGSRLGLGLGLANHAP